MSRPFVFVLPDGKHYHLVLETPEGNLSRFMQKLITAYTVYYNRRHRRHGHVMDWRFKAKLVEGEEYLLKLSRYVHLNPVRVGRWKKRPVSERIAYLGRYRWSSYLEYIQDCGESGLLDKGPVLANMEGRKKDRPDRYREFVETGLAENDPEFQDALKASPLGIGDETFRQWVWGLHRDLSSRRERPEDVTYRRKGASLEPGEVLDLAVMADAIRAGG